MVASLTWVAYLIQEDLAIAASFAHFLRKSNDAFEEWNDRKTELHNSKQSTRKREHRTSLFVARRIQRSESLEDLEDLEAGFDPSDVEEIARRIDVKGSSKIILGTKEIELTEVEPQIAKKDDGTIDLSSF